eukprot:4757771-Pyramimonas_sp.AAC.1
MEPHLPFARPPFLRVRHHLVTDELVPQRDGVALLVQVIFVRWEVRQAAGFEGRDDEWQQLLQQLLGKQLGGGRGRGAGRRL